MPPPCSQSFQSLDHDLNELRYPVRATQEDILQFCLSNLVSFESKSPPSSCPGSSCEHLILRLCYSECEGCGTWLAAVTIFFRFQLSSLPTSLPLEELNPAKHCALLPPYLPTMMDYTLWDNGPESSLKLLLLGTDLSNEKMTNTQLYHHTFSFLVQTLPFSFLKQRVTI